MTVGLPGLFFVGVGGLGVLITGEDVAVATASVAVSEGVADGVSVISSVFVGVGVSVGV